MLSSDRVSDLWSEHLCYDTPELACSFYFGSGGSLMILCECGEFIKGRTFKCYIKTSSNPSTSTIGHRGCGLIFDFVDGELPKRYSSKIELKGLAMRFGEINKLEYREMESS